MCRFIVHMLESIAVRTINNRLQQRLRNLAVVLKQHDIANKLSALVLIKPKLQIAQLSIVGKA